MRSNDVYPPSPPPRRTVGYCISAIVSIFASLEQLEEVEITHKASSSLELPEMVLSCATGGGPAFAPGPAASFLPPMEAYAIPIVDKIVVMALRVRLSLVRANGRQGV